MSGALRYIAVCQSVVGGGGRPFEIVYGWNGKFFASRVEAVREGWNLRDSDDFNVGVVDSRGRLVSFDWMDEPTGETPEDMAHIAASLGLKPPPLPSPGGLR